MSKLIVISGLSEAFIISLALWKRVGVRGQTLMKGENNA